MSQFTRLIRFESAGNVLFADLTSNSSEIPSLGSSIKAYTTFENLINNEEPVEAVVDKVWTGSKCETQILQTTNFRKSFFLPYREQIYPYTA